MAYFDAKLTGIACTQQMRDDVEELARKEQRKTSAIIRLALEKFLAEHPTKSTKIVENVENGTMTRG